MQEMQRQMLRDTSSQRGDRGLQRFRGGRVVFGMRAPHVLLAGGAGGGAVRLCHVRLVAPVIILRAPEVPNVRILAPAFPPLVRAF